MQPSILAITPTYNERENLPALAGALFAVLPEARLLVVDDASPDGTGELADRMAAEDERVAVLHRPAKLGLGSAYVEGFRQGLQYGYDLFVHLDADLSHEPRYLPAMLAAIEGGADIAVGSRRVDGGGVEGWGPRRTLISKGASLYARLLLDHRVRDWTSGFKVIRAEVLEAIDLTSIRSEGYSFLMEVTFRALRRGFRVAEVPIVFVDRRVGQSKLSTGVALEAVRMVPALRLRALLGKL
jgi:dolichol-phosphate mannosyltransferase